MKELKVEQVLQSYILAKTAEICCQNYYFYWFSSQLKWCKEHHWGQQDRVIYSYRGNSHYAKPGLESQCHGSFLNN